MKEIKTTNKVVRNALIALNKPYDIPMGTALNEKIAVSMEEFTHQYGKREMPRKLYTTYDKLPSYLARWGLASQEDSIMRDLRTGKDYEHEINVRLGIKIRHA